MPNKALAITILALMMALTAGAQCTLPATAILIKDSTSVYAGADNCFGSDLRGQCTWGAFGFVMEAVASGALAPDARTILRDAFCGVYGRDAKNWPTFIGGTWIDTNTQVLPDQYRECGLLAVWQGGPSGHVGLVTGISADRKSYRLSDFNRGGDLKFRSVWYDFAGTSDLLLGVFPKFYVLPKPTAATLPPAAPTITSPTQGATIYGSEVTVPHTASATATAYQQQFSFYSSFSSVATSSEYTSTGGVRWTGLPNDGRACYVRVRARNAAGWGAWSIARYFWNGNTSTLPPAAPTITSPTQGATIYGSEVIVKHTASATATAYQQQFSFYSSFSSVATSSEYTSTGGVRWTGLPNDGRACYVRVKARNAAGWGAWSIARYFRNGA